MRTERVFALGSSVDGDETTVAYFKFERGLHEG